MRVDRIGMNLTELQRDAAFDKVMGGIEDKSGGQKLLTPSLTAGRDQSVEKTYRLRAAGIPFVNGL